MTSFPFTMFDDTLTTLALLTVSLALDWLLGTSVSPVMAIGKNISFFVPVVATMFLLTFRLFLLSLCCCYMYSYCSLSFSLIASCGSTGSLSWVWPVFLVALCFWVSCPFFMTTGGEFWVRVLLKEEITVVVSGDKCTLEFYYFILFYWSTRLLIIFYILKHIFISFTSFF